MRQKPQRSNGYNFVQVSVLSLIVFSSTAFASAFSIISKDTIGIDKEELQLKTFTYHTQEEEENPLMKLETPGAKLVALKEQLQEKMKVRREQARQKRQEIYDLDNEEGGFEEEEAELSEKSDTDEEGEVGEGEEEEDFEDMYGDEAVEENEEKEVGC